MDDLLAAQVGDAIGRESELAALHEFLEAGGAAGALVLTGGPGIGKTTLWEAGIGAARERGWRVLLARASGAEAQLAFAALIDLLDGVDPGALGALPAPQLRALEVALLRAEPTGVPPEPHAVALGFMSALRVLAAREPLVIAIDDVQWLDTPSADALAFAVRRLGGEAVTFLLAKRPGASSALERELERRAFQRLEVGPLSLGAIRRLLLERLGLSLSRQVLRRIVESTLGNPLFALEVGRTLAERGPLESGEEIPVPDTVEDLLGMRVARLPAPMRRLLLAVALSADLATSQLEAIAGIPAVDDAAEAGVLVVERDRVRVSHPLLAAAARKRSRLRARRELHLELAGVVADEELRARHLALATERPDAELADTVAAAAAGASARGARQEAVELAEHALRLTPPEVPERTTRLLALATHLALAGEAKRVEEVLSPVADSLPTAAARSRAHLLLSDADLPHADDFDRHHERALAESEDDLALRAEALARRSISTAVSRTKRVADAEAWALEALAAAPQAGADVERLALHALAWARSLRGRPIDDLSERFRTTVGHPSHLYDSIERVVGVGLASRGEIGPARRCFTRLLALADERGEARSYLVMRLHLCEVELRAGEWDAAARLLAEWDESSDRELLLPPCYERCRALLAAGRGHVDEAARWAAEAVAGAEAAGMTWDLLEARRAHAIAALVGRDPERAAETLTAVWEHTRREGIDNPGIFPAAPDLVEALVELGEVAEARAVARCLKKLAQQQDHPWGLASGKRCDALIRLASSTGGEAAETALAEAASEYKRFGLRFDRARSLLLLGRAQRRRRKWGAARSTLEQAASAFEEMGSKGWAEAARSELARVGGRRSRAAGELTEAERRVVKLAVEGLSNKEIARALFVTVPTVEAHLSHAYAKLGVRSRAQLAGRLSAGG